jgi:hypothetical protein
MDRKGAAPTQSNAPKVEVTVQMRFDRWLLGGVLVAGAVATSMDAAKVQSPARPLLVLLFVLFGPPIAIGGLLRGFDPLARAVLAVSSSLVLLTLTAMNMLVGGFWSPTAGLLTVTCLTTVCLTAQWRPIQRRLSAATDALRGHGHGRPVSDGPLADPGGCPIEPQ